MPRILRVFLLCILTPWLAKAQHAPKRELRGAWVATYSNIDWPNKTQTPAQQRTAFITIADHHKATGMNAMYVQVRSQCDALYNSPIDPWSADLTGTQGVAPNPLWDPMEFAIAECHKRGIEFHAWLNPYRAVGNTGNLPGFAATHVAKRHPEWLLSQGTLRVLDPGLPEVRDYIISVICDMVRRYDMDGIHFDDYFYPPAPAPGVTPYNDDATFAAYPRGFTVKADWRRDNVNLLIQRVYDSIKTIKPWVKFGVSPSGIYRNSTNPAIGTPTSGLEHYTTLFADTRKWLQEGWVDYLMPQVYWYMGQPGANYAAVTPWWNNNSYNRHIYIGLAGYKVGDTTAGIPWKYPTQIPDEIRLNRSLANVYGQSVYNTNSLRSNKLGFRDSLRLNFYKKPALLPAMPWRDNVAPNAPSALDAQQFGTDSVLLRWTNNADAASEMDRARQFVIYRSEDPVIDTTTADQILAITSQADTVYTDKTIVPNTTYYYTVTALDRFHNESIASNLSANLAPDILCAGDQELIGDSACTAVLPDYRSLAVVNDPRGVTLTQWPAAGSKVHHNDVIRLIAANAGSRADTCSFAVTLKDTLAPLISNISTHPFILNVPNRKMQDITVDYTLTDCHAATATLSITSNEAGTGADWEVLDARRIRLRAERNMYGNGRIYTITITATDASGNTSQQTTSVIVPGNKPWTYADGLAVTAMPNPTFHQFTLLMTSKHQLPISIRVYNNAGQLMETRDNIAPNSTLTIGADYHSGIYYVEIIQGPKRQILKLIKLGH